ncbi:MAG: hypothetical protein SWJ54_02135 [Cyanobacteriota bacterium]|nr:hypothetical protein [Cyanobacteriota bacterium]
MTETTNRRQKRTAVVTLVLIASISLQSCESSKKREVYRSQQDCQEEWGKPELCTPITDGSYPVGYHYGPYYRRRRNNYYYYRTYNSAPRLAPRNAGITRISPSRPSSSVGRVKRGGFGSRGRVSGRGGRGGRSGG